METIPTLPVAPPRGTTSRELDHHLQRLLQKRRGHGALRLELYRLSTRFQYWGLVLLNDGIVPPIPWPKIKFASSYPEGSPVMKMIRRCLRYEGISFEDLIDWMLYGFGSFNMRELPRRIGPSQAAHLAKEFRLQPFFDEPGDFLGHVFETEVATSIMKTKGGMFFTPQPLCDLMATMLQPGLLSSCHEPAAGSGRMLMSASNYSLALSGQEQSSLLTKVCEINGWLFMPQLVLPCRQLKENGQITFDRKLKNTLERKLSCEI